MGRSNLRNLPQVSKHYRRENPRDKSMRQIQGFKVKWYLTNSMWQNQLDTTFKLEM